MDLFIRIIGRIPLAKRLVGLLFQRHLYQRASVALVAEELDYTADRVDNDHSPVNKFQHVLFAVWDAHHLDVHLRLHGNPELWAEVSGAYASLRVMSAGGHGPSADHLRSVSKRLHATLN